MIDNHFEPAKMNNSTSNSDQNETDKKMTKIKKTSYRLKITTIILALILLALIITLSAQLGIFLNKTNSQNVTNNSDSAKNTTSSNTPNDTTNFNPNKKCKNYTVGKYCDECGLSFRDSNLKIAGGHEANPNSWPSIGYIVYNYKQNFHLTEEDIYVAKEFSGFCSGTLIDRTTFLTAAQCVNGTFYFFHNNTKYETNIKIKPNEYYPSYESIYSLYLGLHDTSLIHNKSLNSEINPAKRYKIVKVIIHEKQTIETKLNDIALFKLSEEAELNDYVQLACLPPKNTKKFPLENSKVYAAGWGQFSYRGENSDKLQNVEINVYNGSACSIYSNTNFDSQICAGELDGGKGACTGDIGAPIYLKETINGTVRHVLVGITSIDYGCGFVHYPGVYTRVSYYLDWINRNK